MRTLLSLILRTHDEVANTYSSRTMEVKTGRFGGSLTSIAHSLKNKIDQELTFWFGVVTLWQQWIFYSQLLLFSASNFILQNLIIHIGFSMLASSAIWRVNKKVHWLLSGVD